MSPATPKRQGEIFNGLLVHRWQSTIWQSSRGARNRDRRRLDTTLIRMRPNRLPAACLGVGTKKNRSKPEPNTEESHDHEQRSQAEGNAEPAAFRGGGHGEWLFTVRLRQSLRTMLYPPRQNAATEKTITHPKSRHVSCQPNQMKANPSSANNSEKKPM